MFSETHYVESLLGAPRLWSRHQVVLEAASGATFAAEAVAEVVEAVVEQAEAVLVEDHGLFETKAETAAGIAT